MKIAKAEFAGDPAFFGILTEGFRETVMAAGRARTHRSTSWTGCPPRGPLRMRTAASGAKVGA